MPSWSSTDDSLSRRQLLAAASTTGAIGLAGCTEYLGDTGGSSSPPYDDVIIPDGPTIDLELIADGLVYPTDLVEVPDGSGRLFVTDQIGLIHSIAKDGSATEVAADLTDRVVDVEGDFSEAGLLGIACHPEFEDTGRVFVRYSASQEPGDGGGTHTEVLAEFTGDATSIDPDSERELLRVPQPQWVHQGGSVLFGPDGYLYLTFGDGGDAFDGYESSWYTENTGLGEHSQTTTDNLLGSVLRIDIDSEQADRPYDIPPDNPLVPIEGHRGEYWAWGFRNPWGASFDGDELYVADVGQRRFESINRVERGGNYGWNIREGTHCYDADNKASPPTDCPDETPEDVRDGEALLGPLIEYPQQHPTDDPYTGSFDEDEQYGSAVIGGAVHRGSVGDLEGAYVFGDWSADPHGDPRGQLFLARPRDDLDEVHHWFETLDLWGIERLVLADNGVAEDGQLHRYVSGMGHDLDGETYVLVTETNIISGSTGEVRRITNP